MNRKCYVYPWAEGSHFNVRLEGAKQCLLVTIGAGEDGRKKLAGSLAGYRESERS